jgi:ergothioneine biosynthesis protein EgtB
VSTEQLTTNRLSPAALAASFAQVRRQTERLTEPLSPEDCAIQSMADASPTRWHLAHTTWFFETFVLAQADPNYQPFHPEFALLFNSYYNAVGAQFPRASRGLLSRPSLAEVFEYRNHVDRRMHDLLASAAPEAEWQAIVELGLNHEQQHQELILTDIKHLLSCNPLEPVYRAAHPQPSGDSLPLDWLEHSGGIEWLGHAGEGFAYDNETPRHRVLVEPFELATRLVTNAEYLEFIADDGYRRPELWLSAGWQKATADAWQAPLYWCRRDERWVNFTLGGTLPVQPNEPVCHVSFFEADAFARWAGARLPTEAEWELIARQQPLEGNLLEQQALRPLPARRSAEGRVAQIFGDAWEWTASPYTAYPGYRAADGALGEYNGKFMCNQYVLRGGSWATPQSHLRATYRNFFPPEARWQISGIRLAR